MGGWEPPLSDYNRKFQWKTRGQNCAYCNIMDGRVYVLDVYISSTVYPGFHKHCNCYLSPVPDDTPTSDLDIFGSSLNMRNDSWLEALFGNWENLWLPNYITGPAEILSFSKPGMTMREVLEAFNARNKTGIFTDYGGAGDVFAGWNVFHNANVDIYQSFGDILTSMVGGVPTPSPLKPPPPGQTYHDTIYNIGW